MTPERHRSVLEELLEWLVSIERLAHDVYRATADALRADAHVSGFVKGLADSEEQHAELMAGIRDLVAQSDDVPPPDICLDATLRETVETPLRRLRAEVAAGTITRKLAVSLIAEVEFTEWNEVFLYVLGRFGEGGREAEKVLATIQEHERSVEAFIGELPPHVRPELDVAKLAKIWDTRLLVVDDDSFVRELLVGLLKSVGQVTEAENGEKALEATRRHFFDAVVTDIQMPGMGGIDFHRRAVTEHPDLQNRFLFISFGPREEEEAYLRDHHLPFLPKPFMPEELMAALFAITSAARVQASACADPERDFDVGC